MTTKTKTTKPAKRTNEARRPQGIAALAEASVSGELSERAVLVQFSIGRWYGVAADEEVRDSVRKSYEAKGDVGTFTKRLMAKERLAEINEVTARSRKFHKHLTLPWGETGMRILSVDVLLEYRERMTSFEQEFRVAVAKFMDGYLAAIKEQKERLGKMFREGDYPSEEEMRARWRFGVHIEQVPRAGDLRVALGEEQLSELRNEIEQRTAERLKEAMGSLYAELREQLLELREAVAHQKVSKASPKSLLSIAANLARLNITHDPRLAELGKDLLVEFGDANFDAEVLREDKAVAKEKKDAADAMLSRLADLN